MSRTVVITGLGATTPLGGDVASTWQGLLEGRSGVHALTEDWAEQLPTRFAARVVTEPTEVVPRHEARRMDRASQLAVVAGLEAWADAGFGLGEENDLDRERLAVSIGTGIGGLHSLLENWDVMKERGVRRVSPFTIPMLMANAPASQIGLRIGAKAGVHTPVSACASSNEALAQGLTIVRDGRADVCVVGGTEGVVHPLPIAAFGQMQALSRRNDEPERASRPWDVDRDGFVLGEGAVVLVLETLEHATARGAKIYGTLAGAGISADSHDIVQPDPTGTGQASAMARALADAQLSAGDIAHVNAHATSTPQGDITEAGSIRKALGENNHAIVTGTKSMTGHLLGAAGALESLATVLALRHRQVPPTINLENPEPDLGIDIAANTARSLPEGDLAALNNSFGFGGPNVAIAFTNANVTGA
ncbi:beta-ketoacyl-[acyl-carrier-protein] synthase II [Enemella dayhoffiae]|uniref:3-oxoacyl-[acyl-carrier-protein] synthase 2 n=1 Tax=Enemella dayhoffiae TaxID=2016507 RepID=A0A255GPD6_9ACTN|nr:beta-ketoacyl-[acyl-carrier-protein] synthase family protein [Enemella dayhoffiae]OYO17272.1 beta-ketoacyl-[acyl-carrier-protein] synthase II [Enemella dayhoffiae]